MSGYTERFIVENIVFIYIEILLPGLEKNDPYAKDGIFSSMCDCPIKDIKFPKLSCVLNCCNGYYGFFSGE